MSDENLGGGAVVRRKAGRVLCPHGSGRAENIIMKLRLGTRPFASHSSSQKSAAGCMSGNETVRNDLSCNSSS